MSHELSGLKRQAETLAVMINRLEGDSEKVIRRSLSKETKELLLPLAGRDNQVRIRLFQPNGLLYADTKSLSQLSPKVEVLRLPKLTDNKQFEKINDFVSKAAKSKQLKNILTTNNLPLVSIDFNHNSSSSVFDLTQTQVINQKFCRVLSWYDNEWGFSNRMIDTMLDFKKFL